MNTNTDPVRALAEGLSETEKNIAVAQAVEFAEYVERQAKGTMRDAAKRFLSLPYSQEVAERLMERDALEKQAREFRRIGSLLANAAYNLAQHSALKGSTREALDNLRRQWDAAIAAANGGGND